MAKKTEDLLNKIIERQKKEAEQEAKIAVEENLPRTGYDIFKDEKNNYKLVVIKYNPETKVAVVSELLDANINKIVAMRFSEVDKNSLETLFIKKGKKSE